MFICIYMYIYIYIYIYIYKQQDKNELTPSQIKCTIFLKILHYHISKLSSKRS